jgi:acyl dehydratase
MTLLVQVRFAAPVYPGEVLEVRAWWEQPPQGSGNNSGGSTRRIIFETRKPDGKRAISNALVEVAPVGWKAAGSQQTLPSGVASKL